jgi:hypothetical protein
MVTGFIVFVHFRAPLPESKEMYVDKENSFMFSRPQIDLNDIMKFDKVKSYIAAKFR